MRGMARVFEIDPKSVLRGLMEAAEQLQAFSTYFLNELHLRQIQLDELYVVMSAVRDGGVSEAEAIDRLSRSPTGCGRRSTPRASCYCTSTMDSAQAGSSLETFPMLECVWMGHRALSMPVVL
jgi:hypothetical protein